MRSNPGIGGGGDLPTLSLGNMLDVFIPGELRGSVGITEREPLVGELLRDATGRFFLAPQRDDRGGGMHSIPIHDLSAAAAARLLDKVVKLTGVFEDGKGVTVDTIALVDELFVPPDAGDRDAVLRGRRPNPSTGKG